MMNKKNLLIITPHLSTGGAPQVTLNKIELLNDTYNIKCVEYNQIAWTFVVQRNRIINILGDNFHTLPDDKSTIINIIEEFKPDSISFLALSQAPPAFAIKTAWPKPEARAPSKNAKIIAGPPRMAIKIGIKITSIAGAILYFWAAVTLMSTHLW